MIGLFATALVLLAVGQLLGMLASWANTSITTSLERAMTVAIGPGSTPADRRRVFVVDAEGRPTADELDAFAREFESRFGALISVSIDGMTREGAELDMSASSSLNTTEGVFLGAVRFRLVPSATTEAALRGIEILDRSRGDLTIGVGGSGLLREEAKPAIESKESKE